MKIIILISALILSSCYSPSKCIDGKLYQNYNEAGMHNIYYKTEKDCKVIE